MGVEGGKPGRARPGVQPEWFYKGDGSCLVAPGAPLAIARLRARRRRGARDRRHLPDRRRRHAAPARLCARQRILRPRHRARQLSVARPFQAAPGRARRRAAARRSAAGRARHQPDPARRRGAVGEAVPVRRSEHVAHASPISSTTISNMRLFRRPGDVHVHFFGTATLSFADGIETRRGRRVRDLGRAVHAAAAQSAGPAGAGAGAGAGDARCERRSGSRSSASARSPATSTCRPSPRATGSSWSAAVTAHAPPDGVPAFRTIGEHDGRRCRDVDAVAICTPPLGRRALVAAGARRTASTC